MSYPNFNRALSKIEEYEQSTKLTAAKTSKLADIKQRIRRMSFQIERLMALNNEIMKSEQIMTSFDSDTGKLTFSAYGQSISIVLNRADPNKPVGLLGQTFVGAYDATKELPTDNAQVLELRRMLEDEIEGFYAQAHRIQKKVQYLFGLKRTECREITIVRNKILEHPGEEITASFGYGDSGPTLSPMKQGESEFHDRGLIHNANSFDEFLENVFDKASKKPK